MQFLEQDRAFRRTFTEHLTAFVLVGVVCAAAFGIFSFRLATRSAPDEEGSVSVDFLQHDLTIYRNEYGIPHIVAASDAEAFFGLGYAHAQDRLWQMELARRVGRGRLSELFGRRTLEYDIFLRHLGIERIAKALYKSINPDARMALDAYTRGVNAYLERHRTQLPFEFDALEMKPEPWQATDCLIIARLMAWELSLSFWTDAAFASIADTLGTERALQLLPRTPVTAPCVTDSLPPNRKAQMFTFDEFVSTAATSPATNATTTASTNALSLSRRLSDEQQNTVARSTLARDDITRSTLARSDIARVAAVARSLRAFLKQEGSAVGSNSWAVRQNSLDSAGRPYLDPTKGAVLANDTHLTLLMPPRWYEAHLTAPLLNVVGFTVPGLPFVVVGRNDEIAWGVTNMMVDDCDFFLEQYDPQDFKRFLLPDGTSKTFRFLSDTLKIRDKKVLGGMKDTVIDIRFAERSAVLSDVHPFRSPKQWLGDSSVSSVQAARAFFDKHSPAALAQGAKTPYFLTFQWTGQQMSDETLAMYRLNKAKNWERFVRAVDGFAVPGLNFTYADKYNNIGIAPAGAVPDRINTDSLGEFGANFPRAGWRKEAQWQGVYEPSALPRLFNPERGYVVSANNQTARKLPFVVSHIWEHHARAERIEDVLSSMATYSAFEAQLMQTDLTSPYAQALKPTIINAVQATFASLGYTERQALKTLAAWSGSMDKSSPAAAVFAVFLSRYARNIFSDELGETLFREYCFVTNLPTRTIAELTQMDTTQLAQYGAWWFDNKATPLVVERREHIILQSFREAVRWLHDRFGSQEPKDWFYGELHQLTIPHVFGEQEAMQHTVNLGPYPVGGDPTTINAAEWKYADPFKPVIGASMRFVCDMRDTVVYVVLPGGNGGQALTRNYSDQMLLWLGGGLIALPVSREPSSSFTKKLVLKAKEQQ
jgi:penicillin amidase